MHGAFKDINDDFKYIYWNKECYKLFGFTGNDVVGKTDFEIYGQERGAAIRQIDLSIVNCGEKHCKQKSIATPQGSVYVTQGRNRSWIGNL